MNRSRLYRSVVFLAVLLSFATIQQTTVRVSGQGNLVIVQPADRADRFGIYNWGVDYGSYPTGALVDRLNWGADKVAGIGTRMIRIAMPGDIYQVGGANDDLTVAAASPAYDRLFSDPRFKTYLLTIRSSTEVTNSWSDGYTQEESILVRDEIARLGEYLLTNPKLADKTFILLNWEGDNAIYDYAEKQSIWDAYTAWIQSRSDGVKLARERHPGSQAKLFSGLEFNLVRDLKTGRPCGTPVADPIREDPLINRCVIDYVAPKVDVDYYSFSSWWTLDVKFQGLDASYKDAIKTDLNFALAKVREKRPEVTEANFIIGEYGMHRTRWGETNVANFVDEFFDAVEAPDAFKVSYAVFWQIIDNVPSFLVSEDGFGLFRSRNGIFGLTRAGETFRKRLAGETSEKWTGGPFISIAPVGVVDAATGTPDLRLDSLLRIDAKAADTPFSVTGNRVNIEQGIYQYLMPRDSAVSFSESTVRINASLPKGLRPGPALIYVTDQEGIESQAQYVTFNCALCPQIQAVEDERKLKEFYPGVVITIRGRQFSPSGNTVAVEQQSEQRVRYRFVVPPADLISESPEEITVRLPAEMITSRFSAVIVADSAGRESNQEPIRVYPEPVGGPPLISELRPIINRETATTNIPAGSVIRIFGGRFSASGNTVVLEQGYQRFSLPRDGNWSESPTQIDAKLPVDLLPGRAQVYLIDAQGRESRAAEFKIARSLSGPRTPIRRQAGRVRE